MFLVCTPERIPYIFLFNDAIDIYIILTESHDQELSNKPIYIPRNTLVNEIHAEQSKCPKHLKCFWGHCIWPSKSQYSSPFFFVGKKDGKLRPVVDYWKLNSFTVPDQYPLPLIQELIDKVRNVRIFTKMDV